MKQNMKSIWVHTIAVLLIITPAFTMVGCDNKEKVLDVETPGGQIEIERDRDTGAVDVEIDKK
tara:strand:+ start:233155 stop:233343 length:189 start_codon:yes stop_codon:yes gene_type:complete